jgi:hypothetical protein
MKLTSTLKIKLIQITADAGKALFFCTNSWQLHKNLYIHALKFSFEKEKTYNLKSQSTVHGI